MAVAGALQHLVYLCVQCTVHVFPAGLVSTITACQSAGTLSASAHLNHHSGRLLWQMVVRLLLTTMFQFGSRVNECKYGVYEPAACMLPTTTKVTVLPKILPDAHCSVTLAQCCTCSYTLLLLQPLDKTFLYLGI